MPINPNELAGLRDATAELTAVSLEAFIAEVRDPTLRELLHDVPALIRTAILDARDLAAAHMAMRKLRAFEAAVRESAAALATEARAFQEALAVMLDDLGELNGLAQQDDSPARPSRSTPGS
jgi:hypothetical protein